MRRLLGSNPEIAAQRTASDRRKDDFAEAEAVKEEPQPEMAAPKPEDNKTAKSEFAETMRELQPIIARKLRRKAEGILTSVAGVITSLKKAARKGTRTEEPTVLFLPAAFNPEIEASEERVRVNPNRFRLQDPSDQIDLLNTYVDDFDVQIHRRQRSDRNLDKISERIRKAPSCAVHKEARGIVLRVERGRRQSEKQAESLRDGILKIVTKNGADYYVLFRDSKIAEKQPLSLSTGTQRLMKDDLSPGMSTDWIG